MSPADIAPKPYPHPRADPAWLARRVEPAVDPDLPIIDAHHHLWDRSGEHYLLHDFLADVDASGHAVRGSVFIQCGFAYDSAAEPALRPVGETRRIAAMVREERGRRGANVPACQAIVGYADLRQGEAVERVLLAHLEVGDGRFRGVRHSAATDPAILSTMVSGTPPPGMLADPAFRRGFAVLAKLGLSYDAWIYHPQLSELEALARAQPEVPIALDHIGGYIGIAGYAQDPAATFRDWRESMARLARCDNVTVKLGGLARPVVGFSFHEAPAPASSEAMAEAWRPWIEACLELYGPARCMFESNFPVDKGLTSYGLLWNAFKHLARGCSHDERHALFSGTAARFYRIDVDGGTS